MNEENETSTEFETPADCSDFIIEFYPELTSEQREESAYYLNRYLDLIEQIYNRMNT